MTKVTRLTLEQGGVLERRRLHLREVADDVDAPLDTVGADLRAARMRKGEELANVSQILKIREAHLGALEDGDISALPGRAYAIGFVRSYAEYVGLDPAACVERFKAEIAGRGEPDEPTVSAFTAEAEERKLPQGWIVFVVLLLIAVIWGGYYLSVSANRMLAQNVTPVPSTLAQQAGIEPTPAPPAPAGPPPVVTTTATTAPGTQPAPATAAPGTQVATIQPQATTQTLAEPAVLPPGTKYGLSNTNSRVTLRIFRPTRVLVQGPSGMIYINRPLKPGDTYQAPNMVGLILTTSDAAGIELIVDGQLAGRAGQGAANGVSLNPQDIMDRASRRAPG